MSQIKASNEVSAADQDTPWVRAYERIWPDPVADDDPRRAQIAQEMRELRAATTLAEGLQAIGWWYNHSGFNEGVRNAEVRDAMRRLRRSKRLSSLAGQVDTNN
ncbi:hypothetical protein J3A72_000540 [Stenotrophomonas sp. PvP093]|uniref:hypothetical protein n=1 Tax=unclassified Stenotrophomonas TaxID=196198 RepID=UPI001AE4F16B|nr:hypothetical protein [Stenotrophomonas sp. PvP093]MBP2480248.1 hypothetical protein [Stenotrophomonas sp. PvP093]